MNIFILMDGAMIHDAIRSSTWFASPGPLFAPLMPKEEQRLAGPILIDQQVALDDANKPEVQRLLDAFPHRLHVGFLSSPGGLDVVAEYMRHYVYFGDDTGRAYGLRISDSRVMAYLPQVLTPQQWDAMTVPFSEWWIHDREGQRLALALNESRKQQTEPARPLHLTDEQVGQLVDGSEPDALLEQIGKAPELSTQKYTLSRYQTACACIHHWKASGSENRAVLAHFIRLVFHHGTGNRNDAAWMNNLLKHAIASMR